MNEQAPSKELAYRDALARIRQVCRSDAKDFEAATIERRQVYDIANMTLDANGDLYASGHEPALEHKDFDEWFASLSKGYWPTLQEVWAAARTAPPPVPELRDDEIIAWVCHCGFINQERAGTMCEECSRTRPAPTKEVK
jgi:hypothetical protein